MEQCKKCENDEIMIDEGESRCVNCDSTSIIIVEGEIRESLKEALSDYIESCNRQCVGFNDIEARRFMRENNHMNITDEEKEYIGEMTE